MVEYYKKANKHKPKIGIIYTGQRRVKQRRTSRYAAAVRRAGGQPVFLPWRADKAKAWARRLDGFLFTGGGDPDPAYYGEAMLPQCGKPNPRRDEAELALLKAVLPTGKPVLGICRGEQMLNVAMGGTLIQDIPTQCPAAAAENHFDDAGRFCPAHTAIIEENSRLYAIFGRREIKTNSVHHQAIGRLAPGLAATAHSPAGIIEAAEGTAPGRFILGIQWHPEALAHRDKEMQQIFDEFLAACRTAPQTRRI